MPSVSQDYDKDEKLAASRIKLQDTYTPNKLSAKRPETRELCKRYMQGICKYGRKCKYSHNRDAISALLESKKAAVYAVRKDGDKEPCIFFTTGDVCQLRGACPDLHDYGLRQVVTTRMKSSEKQKQKTAWNTANKVVAQTRAISLPSSVDSEKVGLDTACDALAQKSAISSFSCTSSRNPSRDTAVEAFAPHVLNTTPSIPHHKDRQTPLPTSNHKDKTSTFSAPNSIGKSPRIIKIFAFQAWNQTENWEFWAKRNLSDAERHKVLGPYMDALNKGQIPAAVFSDLGKKAPASAKFERFPELPFELREMIWKCVLAGERYEHRIKFFHEEEFGHLVRPCFWPQNCAPRLLHVCSESRALALVKYPKTFGTDACKAATWFNYRADRLFVHTRTSAELWLMKDYIPMDARNNLRWISLPLRDWVFGDEKKVTYAVCYFHNLRQLNLVVGDGREDARVVDKKYHAKQIAALVALYWKRHVPKRTAPKVVLEEIPAVRARFYKIDNLTW